MIVTSAVDAWVNEAKPGLNYGTAVRLHLNGGAGTNDRRAFVWFPNKVPRGAKVLSAVLRIRLYGAWAGANTITVTRVTSKWGERTIKWSNQPTVTTTNQEAVVVTGGVDAQLVEFDITDMMQDVANGGAFYGLRFALSSDVNRAFRSCEDANVDYRPQLEIEWTEAPDPPDRLSPDGGVAVSSDSPVLDWRFTDRVGTGTGSLQSSSQVQISSTNDFVADVDFDTGKVSNEDSQYNLADDINWTGALLPDAATLYWRVKVWDGTDFESDWSEPAEFSRDDLGSLVIDEPSVSVPETTPPVIWTLTGETQSKYRLTLFRIESDLSLTQLFQVSDLGTDNSVTIPGGYIVTGSAYRIRVEVWDDVPRAGDEHLTEEVDISYLRDGTPDAVETLTATAVPGSAEVLLGWTRTVAPDYFALVVDGVEVDDRIDPADVLVSANTYEFGYWGAKPRELHTFEIEAVVQASPGAPYLHSNGNPTDTARTDPVGMWLVDIDDGTAVNIVGKESAEFNIGESAATHIVLGAKSPVRITDVIRGYEGPIKGQILGEAARDAFLELKGRRKSLFIVVGDLSIPIRMEDASCTPTSIPGDQVFAVAFNFFQSGPPWPVR